MTLTYAIGDIHGRHAALTDLLARIANHAGGRAHRLVFLGDYIDRGPHSAAVVATLQDLQRQAPERVTCLMGNHEWLLLVARDDPSKEDWWFANGGDATLASYGVRGASDMPADAVAWCRSLPTHREGGRRYYVHAGVRPGLSLAQQSDEDRLWIREPFLSARASFGKYIVHGHTPCRTGRPDVRANRANLDTGAGFGGPLTAGVFNETQDRPLEILQVGGWGAA
jgi:serine/threonine protein phosphatase 1